jgi:hypothetical protein
MDNIPGFCSPMDQVQFLDQINCSIFAKNSDFEKISFHKQEFSVMLHLLLLQQLGLPCPSGHSPARRL